jgi:hypothetical protein
MKTEVKDALAEWIAGIGVGVMPLIAHTVVRFGMAPAHVEAGHISSQGDWAVDFAFLTIATSATSVVSVMNRFRKRHPEVVHERSMPALTVANMIAVAIGSLIYGISAGDRATSLLAPLSIGIFLGAAFLSLYGELALAARTPPRDV